MKPNLRELLGDEALPALAIGGLCCDSRRVRPGDAFIARRGAVFDGHDFAAGAVRAGAAAVISERPLPDLAGAVNIVVPDVAARLGALGSRCYGAPSAALDVIGVTGTNGKTSVAYSAARMLGGGYIGTLGWGVPPKLRPSALTTADPIALQAELRALADRGCTRVAMEVSSHALHQGRADAVRFAVGIFTNLSRDHLDYHGTMEAYAAAKRRLFRRPLRAAVVNADDAVGRAILAAPPAGAEVFSVGRAADVYWSDVAYAAGGLAGRWHTPWGTARFELPGFFGDFSLYNAAEALAACCALGMALADAAEAMRGIGGVPGRMQAVAARPAVLVDYAHTPDGLAQALCAARAHLAGGRLLVVFGCGGERDRGKRAQMARVAEAGADLVVVTSDNPRGEDPARILDDARAGFAAPDAAVGIVDRRAAIAHALSRAGGGDLVLVAGKGHETFQEIGGKRLPFNDADVAVELLAARRGGGDRAAGELR